MEFDQLDNTDFAGFSVSSKVGESASGIVYEASADDIALHLKTLPPLLSSSDHPSAARFLELLETAATLRHDNLIGILIVDEADGVRFVSLERADGPTLSEVLGTRGALPLHEGAAILRQVLSGLEVAHGAGLVHGELEPMKILQHGGSSWKIGGIGFPERYLLDADAGVPGRWPDLAQYASPESAGVLDMDPRSDLYSLGVIAFEIFTGEPPFLAETDDELRELHGNAQPRYPGDDNPSLSPFVCEYVLKLLAKAPEDRFPDASTAARALEAALAGVGFDDDEPPFSDPTEVDAEITEVDGSGTGTGEGGGGGLLAAAWASEVDDGTGSGESTTEQDPAPGLSLTDEDKETLKQAKGPTQVIEGVFASLGGSSTIRKKKGDEEPRKDERGDEESPVTGLIQKEDTELPWDLGGDESASESRETFDISGSPGAEDGWERGGAETEEGFEGEAPLEGFVEDDAPAGKRDTEKKVEPEGEEEPEADPEEEAAALEKEKGRAVTTAEDHFGSEAAVEEEEWVDLGPWKKGQGGEPEEKKPTFDEFHEMRMGVASDVESKVSESGRALASMRDPRATSTEGGDHAGMSEGGGGRKPLNPVILIVVPAVLLIAVGVLVVLLIQASGKKPVDVPPGPRSGPKTLPSETKAPPRESPPEEKGEEKKVEKPAVDKKEMEAKLASAVELKREGNWKGAVEALKPLVDVEFLSKRAREELDGIEAKRIELARSHREGGRPLLAIAVLEDLEKVFPGRGHAKKAIGVKYEGLLAEGKRLLGLGMTDDALKVLGEAVALGFDGRAKELVEKTSLSNWREKAAHFETTRYWVGAVFYYKKILEVLPDDETLKAKVKRLQGLVKYDEAFKRMDALFAKADYEGVLREAAVAEATGVDEGTVGKVRKLLESIEGMITIPACDAVIGSDEGMQVEQPVHKVKLAAFSIMENEVTVEEYARFVLTAEGKDHVPEDFLEQRKHPKRPVVGVSLANAKAYAAHKGLSLPTEAQWERAARGEERRTWPWGEEFWENMANTVESGKAAPLDVTENKFDKSPDGVRNLGGNVAEWTSTPYGPYSGGAAEFPAGQVVLRGGDFTTGSQWARGASRRGLSPEARRKNVGFRCALTLDFASLKDLK